MLSRRMALGTLALLAGCSTFDEFMEGSSPALKPGQTLPPGTAVVLVGIRSQQGGSKPDLYLFNHASLPGFTFRFPPQSDRIVAVPIPVGTKKLKLRELTISGQPISIIGTQTYGYVPVETRAIDIDRPGIYYLATLTVWRDAKAVPEPIPDQLMRLRAELGSTLLGLEPINFQWPER